MFGRKSSALEPELEALAIKQFDGDKMHLVLGGYYAEANSDGTFNVLRILDFRYNAVHASLLKPLFDVVPSFKKVSHLRPYILHVPLSTSTLLGLENGRLKYIGARNFTADDMDGYAAYLEAAIGMSKHDIKSFFANTAGKTSVLSFGADALKDMIESDLKLEKEAK